MWLLYFQVGCASRTWWIDTHSGISLNSPETQTLASHVIHILDSICWTKSVIIFFFHLSLKYDSAKTTSHWAFEKFWYFSVNVHFVRIPNKCFLINCIVSDSNDDHNLDNLFHQIATLKAFNEFQPQLSMIDGIYQIHQDLQFEKISPSKMIESFAIFDKIDVHHA